MQRKFYRSLDRPVSFFGLKGEWIRYALYGVGIGVMVGLTCGLVLGIGAGIGIAIVGVFVSFVVCLVLQGRISGRRLARSRMKDKMRIRVIRHEALSRIVLPDDAYEKAFLERKVPNSISVEGDAL